MSSLSGANMINKSRKHIIEKFGSQALFKNGLDILVADNEDDLFILIAERYRPIKNRRKDNTHRRWVKSQLHNQTLNGYKLNDTTFICYDIYS